MGTNLETIGPIVVHGEMVQVVGGKAEAMVLKHAAVRALLALGEHAAHTVWSAEFTVINKKALTGSGSMRQQFSLRWLALLVVLSCLLVPSLCQYYPGEEESPSIGSCLDINSILPTFKSQLIDAVNLPTIDTYLNQFKLKKGDSPNAVFNFRNLGNSMANLSAAIQWAENKPQADQALDKLNAGASSMLYALADVVRSINFTEVAIYLEYAGYVAAFPPAGIDGAYAVSLVDALSTSINVTRLGSTVELLAAQFNLQYLGSDFDAVKRNLDIEQLVGVLAGLPDAIDFYQAGRLLSGMASSFNFAEIGSIVNQFILSAGTNLGTCYSR